MKSKIRESAAREGRALVILLLIAAAYVMGSVDSNCWALLLSPFGE